MRGGGVGGGGGRGGGLFKKRIFEFIKMKLKNA
jgi:hypothetical protein